MDHKHFNWPGSVVDNVLQSLAGIVPVGTPIHFEMNSGNGYWKNCDGVRSIQFTCPQIYPAASEQQAESEFETQRS